MVWPVVFYRAQDGSEPVNVAVDALPAKVQVAIDNQIERLALFGPDLGFPYTSQIDGELRELRCHFGDDHYRILYQRSRNLFVLLHFLDKRTRTVPAVAVAVEIQRSCQSPRERSTPPERQDDGTPRESFRRAPHSRV